MTLPIEKLREWMAAEGVAAFYAPTSDPHGSEYLPAHFQFRKWLTGFTGSAGTAVVTQTEAALWTDSRYWLQAEEELRGSGIILMKEGEPGVPETDEWICRHTSPGDVIAADGSTLMIPERDMLADLGRTLRLTPPEVTDSLWEGRPPLPNGKIRVQNPIYTSKTAAEKLAAIRNDLRRYAPDCSGSILLNELADAAWLLNLRGGDVDYNPVFLAYLYVGQTETALFVDDNKLTDEAREALRTAEVSVLPYDETRNFVLKKIAEEGCIAMARTMNSMMVEGLVADKDYITTSPVEHLRAKKDEGEIAGMREAMLRDGVALVRFRRWLDEAVTQGGQTEMSIDRKLTALRAEQKGFEGLSFGTIAGYGPHGAIVHYEANEASSAALQPKGLLLLDSGAQYDCGTTDITRTIALGPLTDEERHVYTLVLKGHIALSQMQFPKGTTGLQLDTAARMNMWRCGYDFGHGTGHGVGSHLCCHEGPHQIRKNLRGCTMVPFEEGMVVTNEPGIYVAGKFGVRIENILLTVPAGKTDFGDFLKFETLTLCPIDTAAIERSILNKNEIAWLNDYHRTVREKLLPLLTDNADREWLIKATNELD